ncbi:hypothetical protein HHI36_005905 [Cryptolaemus montrouzieri]|uniref:Uncharacterized protein n=1 Tax=Cryptolaemus montrouzieri TaxID=559131 RepID=A0ABD2NVS0_9CUCU
MFVLPVYSIDYLVNPKRGLHLGSLLEIPSTLKRWHSGFDFLLKKTVVVFTEFIPVSSFRLSHRCNELRDCVECKVFDTGVLKGGDCDLKCISYIFHQVDEIKEDELVKGERVCRFLDTKTCSILYKYSYDTNKNLAVKVQKYKRCPPNPLVWTGSVVGSIVLIALISLIIWKLFTSIYDRREYARFENERKNLKWNRNENPLYRDVVATFKNPSYNT